MENIAYKVVTNPGRKSCNCISNEKLFKDWILTYERGTIVEAVTNTPGIMTFETSGQAYFFKELIRFDHTILKPIVIQVKGIGPGRKILYVLTSQDEDLDKNEIESLFDWEAGKGRQLDTWTAPPGTIVYDKVEVLT